jgi:uncharacterized protein Smg (DUF494 family)
MNEEFFEMLLSLFEKALTHLRSHQQQLDASQASDLSSHKEYSYEVYQNQSAHAMRVLTIYEQVKLTKPAIQFLMRLMHTGMLNSEQFEEVMNLVLDSHLRYVTVSEISLIIHQVLAEGLSQRELLMLEFAFDLETSPTTMH